MSRVPFSRGRGWAIRMAVLGGLAAIAPSGSSDASARAAMLGAPSCTEDCNRKASDCLDGCEEKFKSDDKARVTCKFECANKRQACEKDCG